VRGQKKSNLARASILILYFILEKEGSRWRMNHHHSIRPPLIQLQSKIDHRELQVPNQVWWFLRFLILPFAANPMENSGTAQQKWDMHLKSCHPCWTVPIYVGELAGDQKTSAAVVHCPVHQQVADFLATVVFFPPISCDSSRDCFGSKIMWRLTFEFSGECIGLLC
jgi:hypothetical protein